ncbi:MAG: hypothetical protein JWN95_1750 [Frankiales bacterium]|nr:hypothetical protein [Frankiales bacterium]
MLEVLFPLVDLGQGVERGASARPKSCWEFPPIYRFLTPRSDDTVKAVPNGLAGGTEQT